MALVGSGFQCKVKVDGVNKDLQSDGTLGSAQFQFASPADLASALTTACENETGTAQQINVFKTPV